MEYNEIEQMIHVLAAELARQWFSLQSATPVALYIFYRSPQPGEAIAKPVVAPEAPGPEWEMAHPCRIGPMMTIPQAREHILGIVRRLPILGVR